MDAASDIGRRILVGSNKGLDASTVWWVVFLIILFLVLSVGVCLLIVRCVCGTRPILHMVRRIR